GDREKAEKQIADKIHAALEEVESLDQDRIIRRFLNAIESTLRTNYWQSAEGGGEKTYL
ncbi:MAG: NAD-glutamate dehydrogenase, partial [Gammaproteobacteria bacterium]|nr:NAD-glutamate dehydrogenase [Gammaproteobacteria bacterium]